MMIFGPLARAGFVNDDFDPPTWAGRAQFFVPDPPSPCLGLGPGFHSVNGIEDSCQGVAFLSLSGNFGGAHLSFSGHDTSDIFGMVLGTGPVLLQGISSDLIQLNCSGACDDSNWFVQFVSGDDVLLMQDSTLVALAPTEVFTNATPEPGSFALILGALGAGWIARRRKIAT
jgi:hypothetical protein